MDIQIYEELANKGDNPKSLAQKFLKNYYKDKPIIYPINPFKMLRESGVVFIFRDFSEAEGVYIPPSSKEDNAVVGINSNRRIQRQRFTAAHELCHHLKDQKNNYYCIRNDKNKIEKYANEFAAEILMPTDDFRKYASNFIKDGTIEVDDVLRISYYFGVSYEACLRKILFEMSQHRYTYKDMKKIIKIYKPQKKRLKLGLFDTKLYEQLIDSMPDVLSINQNNKFSCEVFKSEYIFYDSRMEGVQISKCKAGDIIADLRLKKQNSEYCCSTNKKIIEVAGLSLMYDYVFNNAKMNDLSVYEIKTLNKILYSCAPHPENQGEFRNSNAVVLETKFEITDFTKIYEEIMYLGNEIDYILNKSLTPSAYIENVARIHHKMTIIHPFQDGNGRTSRSYSNMLLLRKDLPPVFFAKDHKTSYKRALAYADKNNNYDFLYEEFFKSMIYSFAKLTENIF